MPFVVPLVAVLGKGLAAVAGAGLGGTALSMAWNLRDSIKHTTSPVSHLLNLTEGDHISVVAARGDLPFQHAVVVQAARDPRDKVKVIYHSGSGAGARVELGEVELYAHARNGELLRHQNEALVCYSAESVVARAESLCAQSNSAERREVIRNYWTFFRDDQHFANWCQIGFCFNDGIKARLIKAKFHYAS